jgi:hypothetical protein
MWLAGPTLALEDTNKKANGQHERNVETKKRMRMMRESETCAGCSQADLCGWWAVSGCGPNHLFFTYNQPPALTPPPQ